MIGSTGIDVAAEFERGGKTLVSFLTFCVTAYHMEVIFAYLVRDYRFHPAPARALALYDCFCAPGALARMSTADGLLPPRNIRFGMEMEALRIAKAGYEATRGAATNEPGNPADIDATTVPRSGGSPSLLEANNHFGHLVDLLLSPESSISNAGRAFNPALSATQNLPGGKMTQAQRNYVDFVWRPRVAPVLVGAGFWRAASLA